MSSFIKPTVGRVVLLMVGAAALPGFARPAEGEPCAALVTRVWGDRCINVAAFDANGACFGFTSVRLLQEDDTAREGEMHAKWMDYQKGQAAKAEQLEAKLASAPQPPVDNAFVAPGCQMFTGVAAGLQPHQQRVVDERAELDERLAKLGAFIKESPIFKTLDAAEQGRLQRQESAMSAYTAILGERIAAFA